MTEVEIPARNLEVFDSLLSLETRNRVHLVTERTRERMAGRVLWNINSTARGGGVVEMLSALLAYARGAGVDTRWLVMEGTDAFFRVTKRLHHALHGSLGDGSRLEEVQRQLYDESARDNAEDALPLMRARDVLILHDPQTLGLAPWLKRTGVIILWRCHVGTERWNDEVERGWHFLAPYLEHVDAAVFSRPQYIPPILRDKSVVIPPSIDVFSAKNDVLSDESIRGILTHTGLVDGGTDAQARWYRRADGAPSRVDRAADILRLGRAPSWDTPLVVQVARWDPLKDPIGVMEGFTELVRCHLRSPPPQLVLAGPSVHSVADDPEAAETYGAVIRSWRLLPHWLRSRIHLACLPMVDAQENAAIVNALQRHATVVVQKSREEGFGLTVTEAMWKARPVVATAVGGIRDQIESGVQGLLLDQPNDLAAFARCVRRFLEEPSFAAECGRRAQERVRDRFLAIRQLVDYAELLARLDAHFQQEPAAAQLLM